MRRRSTRRTGHRIAAEAGSNSSDNIKDDLRNLIFPCFPRLPLEIQRMIWSFAVPKVSATFVWTFIPVINNFDFNHRRAILPCPKDLAVAYQRYKSSESLGKPPPYNLKQWNFILSLLQTSRDSRAAALRTYRLDCQSIIPAEKKAWWNDNDVIYFPTRETFDLPVTRLLSGKRAGQSLASIRHIAVNFTYEIIDSFREHACWTANFPSLSSFRLMIQPELIEIQEGEALNCDESFEFHHPRFGHTVFGPRDVEQFVLTKLQEMEIMSKPRVETPDQYLPEVKCSPQPWNMPQGTDAD